jgi:hypothetical protein
MYDKHIRAQENPYEHRNLAGGAVVPFQPKLILMLNFT